MTTDTKFFTNDAGFTLLDRFKATLKDARYFDVLVGYFRLSGFHQLYDSFDGIEKTRILIGLNVDRETYDIIQHSREQIDQEGESEERQIQKYLLQKAEILLHVE